MRRRRTLLALSLAVVLLVGIVVGVAAAAGWGPFADDAPEPAPTTSGSTESPTTGPAEEPTPTETETGSAPATPAPEETSGPTAGPTVEPTSEPTDAAPPAGTDTATVVITYAGWEDSTSSVEVGAYAALLDSAGQCTLTLTQTGTTRTQTIDALVDVSTMSCGGFQIGRGDLAPGTWTAVVTYESAASSGTSEPVEVVVP